MRQNVVFHAWPVAISLAAALLVAAPREAPAHCDTLDGPVVEDARKALQSRDVTPALKWVGEKDEKTIRSAFRKALSDRSQSADADQRFFETLVKVHRAGEGAPFTGLKAAGTIDPAIAEADKALESGSPDAVVRLVTEGVREGIVERHRRAAEAYRHKDQSVAQGREFVAAYVDYTHYVEHLRQTSTAEAGHAGQAGHGEQAGHDKQARKNRHKATKPHPKH